MRTLSPEEREVNRALKEKAQIQKEFKKRMEFRQRVERSKDIYIDEMDRLWQEPSIDWFLQFIKQMDNA